MGRWETDMQELYHVFPVRKTIQALRFSGAGSMTSNIRLRSLASCAMCTSQRVSLLLLKRCRLFACSVTEAVFYFTARLPFA